MHASWILAEALGLFFTALGTAKVLSLPPMRRRAEHLGFTAGAYRVIGVCELAGAAGLAGGRGGGARRRLPRRPALSA
jgi:hypothetical protein